MNSMFANCKSLTSIKFSQYKTENLKSLASTFENCHSLINIDLSHFDTQWVTTMNKMFFNCTALTSLDLSNFRTRNVLNMNYAFCGCSNLEYLDITYFTGSSEKMDVISMFDGFISKGYIKVNSFYYNQINLKELLPPEWNITIVY